VNQDFFHYDLDWIRFASYKKSATLQYLLFCLYRKKMLTFEKSIASNHEIIRPSVFFIILSVSVIFFFPCAGQAVGLGELEGVRPDAEGAGD
ncbi:hypothetical protein, partial [Klebsiella pneumoniae]|uniref:hypothetical protein n=1 Tax=Klebsiella pneumoniae TaxID=573 RepID=UPI0025A2A672